MIRLSTTYSTESLVSLCYRIDLVDWLHFSQQIKWIEKSWWWSNWRFRWTNDHWSNSTRYGKCSMRNPWKSILLIVSFRMNMLSIISNELFVTTRKENNFFSKPKPPMTNKCIDIKNSYSNCISTPVWSLLPESFEIIFSLSAQCYLKLRNYERTVKNCNEALRIDANNVKALFRISIAYRCLQQFDQARITLNTAINIEPYNPEVIDEAQRLDRAIEQQKKTEQKLYYRMFNH